MKKCFLFIITSFLFFALHAQNWKAQWVSTAECQSATNTWLAYRKTVDLQDKPQKVVARIAVDSKYWMWINGQLAVFEGGLKRGYNPSFTRIIGGGLSQNPFLLPLKFQFKNSFVFGSGNK